MASNLPMLASYYHQEKKTGPSAYIPWEKKNSCFLFQDWFKIPWWQRWRKYLGVKPFLHAFALFAELLFKVKLENMGI